MRAIAQIVASHGWTKADAARRCAITQPRMNDLLRGCLSRFSLAALVNIAAALGQRVHLELEPVWALAPCVRAASRNAVLPLKAVRQARGPQA